MRNFFFRKQSQLGFVLRRSHEELALELPSACSAEDAPISTKLHVRAHGMTEMSSSQRANWAEASERKQSSSEIPTMLHFGTSLHRSGQGTAERVVKKKKTQTNRETS